MNQKAPSSPIVPAVPKVKLTPTLPGDCPCACGEGVCHGAPGMRFLCKWELKTLQMGTRRGARFVI